METNRFSGRGDAPGKRSIGDPFQKTDPGVCSCIALSIINTLTRYMAAVGIRLGRSGADRLAPAHRAAAIERARQLAPMLAELKSAGMSARQMAAELTARGIATPGGGRWHAMSVIRMVDRARSV